MTGQRITLSQLWRRCNRPLIALVWRQERDRRVATNIRRALLGGRS